MSFTIYQARWQPLLLAIKCPHTFSLPPVVCFSYVHCSTVLNCPRICVCSINRIAFVASLCSFRIALRSSRPIPESSSRRRFRRRRHCVRMWATVCLPSLHSQTGLWKKRNTVDEPGKPGASQRASLQMLRQQRVTKHHTASPQAIPTE